MCLLDLVDELTQRTAETSALHKDAFIGVKKGRISAP
jgi:hypothetical protein